MPIKFRFPNLEIRRALNQKSPIRFIGRTFEGWTFSRKKNIYTVNKVIQNEKEKKFPQILAIIISSISAITYGMLLSWTSPFIVKIVADKEYYDINEEQASYFTVIAPIIMILSCPVFSKISDRFGRKNTLLLLPVPQILAFVMTIVSNDVGILYLSRVFVGIADGCLYSTLPVYIGEISVPSIRGICGNLVSVFILLGVFLINVIGTYLDVKMSAYISIIVPVVYFLLMFFMPESPYYYLTKNDEVAAKTSLRRLRGIQNVDEIFSRLKIDQDNTLSQTGSWAELFTIKSNRRALTAGVFLRISHQLGGAATFNVYTKLIFEKSKAGLGSELPSMISSGLGFCCIFISGYFIERLGRKTSYLFSQSGCGLVLLFLAIYFYLDQHIPSLDLSAVKWLPIAGMILFYVFNSFGLFNIPTLMTGELFSTSIKAKAMSIVTLTFGVFMFLANNIFHYLEAKVGLFAAMLFFSLANIVSVIFTLFLVPETKGKTLEEIQQILGGENINDVN